MVLNVTAPKRVIIRNPEPQPGQQQAIAQLDRDLIVSAGAGSGKTWVLTERYIEMLNNGARPEQIVAITFTKKAAAEMKGRIRKAIVKMEETSRDREEAAYWNKCRQELERAVITTIHGFCTRLLRDAPLEAGIDPSFRVMDDTAAVLLERQIFSQTVDEWLARGGLAAETVYRELGDRRTVFQSALALHEQMRTHHVQKEQILTETLATLDERKTRFLELRDELFALTEDSLNLVERLLHEKKNPPNYLTDALSWLKKMQSAMMQAGGWDGTHEKAITDVFVTLKANMWRNSGPDEMKECHTDLKEKLSEWLLHTEAPGYRELLRAVLDLTAQAADKYREKKRSEQMLDFHDLEQLTADMLRNHPHIAKRWQDKISYLMVDEFQDTNGLQKHILDQLTGEGGHVKRFVVGDGKQSIYKFRGADVAVFNRTDSEIRHKGGEAVSLDVNFRTQHRLIAYINSLFRFLMKREAGDPDYVVAYEPLVAHRRPPHAEPAVELLALTIDKDSDEGDPRQTEAERVAKRIRLMVQKEERLVWRGQGGGPESPTPVKYGDVALLLATRTHLHIYEQALRSEGIPYLVVGGRGFYDRQEVLDVLNVLKLVQNRDDELALLAFLRSPFVHLSDETLYWLTREQRLSQAFYYLESPPPEVTHEQWERLLEARERLLRWERMKQTENVYRLMRHIVDETGYLSVLLAAPNGEQAVLNVEKLLDIARDIDRRGLSLFDFLEWIETVREEDMQETEAELIRDRGDAVVLMTVHASKGLEFPVVVLPELSRQLLKGGGAGPRVLYAPERGLAVKMFRENSDPEGDGLFDGLRKTEQDRELKEAYRLFYVAVTRARDYLLLSGSQEETKKPREQLKNDWLDWVVKHLGAKQLSELPEGKQSLDEDWSLKVTWDLDDEPDERVAQDAAMAETTADITTGDPAGSYPLYAPLEVGDETEIEPQSVSALMDYTKCPRLFVVKHHLKLPLALTTNKPAEGEAADSRLTPIEIGNILHRVMERVEQGQAIDEQIKRACKIEGLDTSVHSEVAAYVLPLVENYCQSDWFVRSQKAVRIWNELPFHYRLGGYTVSGVIDKLFLDEHGEASILDFKTNRVRDEKHLRQLVTSYEIQVQIYAVVVQELLRVPVKEALLYFLQDDRPVKIEIGQPVLERKKQEWSESLAAMHRLSRAREMPHCTDESCHCRQYLVIE